MDAEEVGTCPGSVPVCRPSSHWVTIGTSAYQIQASGSSALDTATLRPASMSNGQFNSGRNADLGTAAKTGARSGRGSPPP
ncbi:hypothetical protein [Streptomyces megasporus]|uniref:hypothetical protein n=1 Tax=Streptomyces megasporus TaxID=44060 RepID=UPI00316AD92E